MSHAKSVSQKRLAASQASRAYHRFLRSGLQPLALERAPTVFGLVDPSGGDGTLWRSAVDTNLKVEISEWDFLPEDDEEQTAYLQLSNSGPDDRFFRDVGVEMPVTEHSSFPLPMEVPVADLSEGNLWLRYRLFPIRGEVAYSEIVPLICDRTAPHNLRSDMNKLDGLEITAPYIDDDYLDSNPQGIKATIPDYAGHADGDTYQVFYFDHPPEEHDDYSDPAHQGPVITGAQEALIPADVVRKASDGKYYLVYYLFDKAGNKSRVSLNTSVNVALGALPDNLKDPEVLSKLPGEVYLQDAIDGVEVQIRAYDNYRQDDYIAITWGQTPLPQEPVSGKPFPIDIRVPSSILKHEYGDATGQLATPVSYRIMRGEVPSEIRQVQVQVDFSVFPTNPVTDPWPNPINPKLTAPTVKGKNSQTDNVLDPTDFTLAADLSLPLFDDAFDGNVLDFYWDGVLAVEGRVVDRPRDNVGITVPIPWEKIEAGGNKMVPVHYTVREFDSAKNEQSSPAQTVDVTAIVQKLPLPSFLHMTGGWINCNSLRENPDELTDDMKLRVQIPDMSAYLKVGDIITLFWEPYIGSSESNGESPVPGAEKKDSVVLDETTLLGFTWKIDDYDTNLLPTYTSNLPSGRSRARVRYAKSDESITSDWAVEKLSLLDGTSSCQLLTP
ncbi:MAG TPA: hypothetical protein DGQ94_13700 [Pseudomonas sp.]|nr:hypothetical protein [Pseudomonas sp.]